MSLYDLIKIAKNDSYELVVNTSGNHLISSYFGIWDKTSHLDNYINDIQSSIEKLTDGFSLLVNLSQYRGSSSEYASLHVEGLRCCVNAGLGKVAIVLHGNPMLKVSIDYIFKISGISPTYFNHSSSAEAWLSM